MKFDMSKVVEYYDLHILTQKSRIAYHEKINSTPDLSFSFSEL